MRLDEEVRAGGRVPFCIRLPDESIRFDGGFDIVDGSASVNEIVESSIDGETKIREGCDVDADSVEFCEEILTAEIAGENVKRLLRCGYVITEARFDGWL